MGPSFSFGKKPFEETSKIQVNAVSLPGDKPIFILVLCLYFVNFV